MSSPIITQELDTLKFIGDVSRKTKKTQAIILQKIELLVDKRSPEYEVVRKVILDETNNNARAIVRLIFGDIDYLVK